LKAVFEAYEIYLFSYNKSVPRLHLGHQLIDHPEATVTTTKSPNLRHWLDQLDSIIEVNISSFRSSV